MISVVGSSLRVSKHQELADQIVFLRCSMSLFIIEIRSFGIKRVFLDLFTQLWVVLKGEDMFFFSCQSATIYSPFWVSLSVGLSVRLQRLFGTGWG